MILQLFLKFTSVFDIIIIGRYEWIYGSKSFVSWEPNINRVIV